MKLIDTHCHLNLPPFANDLDEVIRRARQAGVIQLIIPAIDLETCESAIQLARRYTGVFVAVGIHPNSTADFHPSQIERLRMMATTEPKVVAIGEIGLDYHWKLSPPEKQAEAFRLQLALARELALPLIIHNREASTDTVAILAEWQPSLPPTQHERIGVLHSFSASQAIADQVLSLGFHLGFTGPLTYKNADELRQIASRVPHNRLLIETDAPYLAPQPQRGKRNESAYVIAVAERLATLHQVSTEQMADVTTENARRLFGLGEETL
ncbi:MAG: TatD family hydrolase [Phototrophicaceae bacterium]